MDALVSFDHSAQMPRIGVTAVMASSPITTTTKKG
jgi:hypothetical protein